MHIKFVKTRNAIEKFRKEVKDPAWNYGKRVDAIAKEFQEIINGEEKLLYAQRAIVEDHEKRIAREAEEREENRKKAIREKLDSLKTLPMMHLDSSCEVLSGVIGDIEVPDGETYQEDLDHAVEIYKTVMSQLEGMYATREKVEEADALRAKEQERIKEQELAREDEIRKEREDLEAEREKLRKENEDLQAKLDAQDEERKLKEAQDEADALEKEQRREAKKKLDESIKSFNEQFSSSKADLADVRKADILSAIIDGKISNVEWTGVRL